jgi:POT family proton-dependent oligopeptide transporter
VLQAEKMDRNFLGVNWYESQVQAVNPFLILVLIPLFAYVIYPLISKTLFEMTPLRKIGIGFFLTAGAFTLSALIEQSIIDKAPAAATSLWGALGQTGAANYDGLVAGIKAAKSSGLTDAQIDQHLNGMPNIAWQFLAYIILTAAEVMVSITSLEFAYTQAPRKMKSFIMGVYFLGVSLGNLFTSGVNYFIQNADGTVKLDTVQYYWFFTGLMGAASLVFVVYSQFYKGRTYLQGEGDPTTPIAPEPKCPSCGRSLVGEGGTRCPECGAVLPSGQR